MANTIRLKRKSTTGAPTAGQLVEGELAINTFDQKLYSKDATTIFELTDHDALTNYIANEHIDWTNATDNFLTTGTVQGSTFRTQTQGFDVGDGTADKDPFIGFYDTAAYAVRQGFVSFSDTIGVTIRNEVVSTDFTVQATDAGSVLRTSFYADPDGVTLVRGTTDLGLQVKGSGTPEYALYAVADGVTVIYNNGNGNFRTHSAGISVNASLNPFIAFYADYSDTTRTAFLQSTALSGYWRNERTSSNMNISSWNSANAPVTHFDGDPDAGVTLYYQGFSRLTTTTSGATLLGSLSANSATFEASSGNTALNIQKAAADDQGTVTYRNELGTQRYIFGMAGSTDDDFFIGRYNDSGVWQGSALYVDGITGQVDLRWPTDATKLSVIATGVDIFGDLGVTGSITADGGFTTAYASGISIHSTSPNDVSLSSTNHPFQIGLTSGLNIRADNNEIMAVNNGVASTLNIQTVGGLLDVGVQGEVSSTFYGSTVFRRAAGGNVVSVRDSGGAGIAADPYLSFQDSAGTRIGYVGVASASTNDMYLTSDAGDVILRAGGNDIWFEDPTKFHQSDGLAKDYAWFRDTTDANDIAIRYNGTNFEIRSEAAGAGNSYIEFTSSANLTLGGALLANDIDCDEVRITANTSFVASDGAKFYRQSTNGASIQGVTGSVNDLTLQTPSGQLLLANPTGTSNVSMAGNLTVTGSVAGTNVTSGEDPGHTHTPSTVGLGSGTNNYIAVWNGTGLDSVGSFDITNAVQKNAVEDIASRWDFNGGLTYTGELVGVVGNANLSDVFVSGQPESKTIWGPMFQNDAAYARLKGGSVAYTGFVANPSDASTDIMFDPTGNYLSIPDTNISVPATGITITVTLPYTMNYSAKMGIVFGGPTWRFSDVKMEAFSEGAWVTVKDVTASTAGEHWGQITGNSVTGTTQLRFTLKDTPTTSARIMSIWCADYNTPNMSNLYLPNNGGTLYGGLTGTTATFSGNINTNGDIVGDGVTDVDNMRNITAENLIIGDPSKGTVATFDGGIGGATIASFRRDVGGTADTAINMGGGGGLPFIGMTRDVGAAPWAFGIGTGSNFAIAQDTDTSDTANYRFQLTSSGDAIFSGKITADEFTSTVDATQPWLTLDSTNAGDNWTAQGAGISVGENGKKGGAAIHMTYNGDGSGYLGMGAVDDTVTTGGRPSFGHFDFTYNTTRVLVGGRLFPGKAAANETTALSASDLQSTAYIEDCSAQNYGSINVTGAVGTSGTYSGISVNRKLVMMHNGTATAGLYNDNNNQWVLQYTENAGARLYYAGLKKLETVTGGIDVTGTLAATTVTGINVTSGADPGHTHTEIPFAAVVQNNGTAAQLYFEKDSLSGNSWRIGSTGSTGENFIFYDDVAATTRLEIGTDGVVAIPGSLDVTGDITADNFEATGLGPTTTPGASDLYMGGYGIIGDRSASTIYVTNANANTSSNVALATGGNHAAANVRLKVWEENVTGRTSSGQVNDHGGTLRDIGFNVLPEYSTHTSGATLDDTHAGHMIIKGASHTISLGNGTAFPVGSMCTVMMTAGTLTIDDDGTTAVYLMDGASRTDVGASMTMSVGGVCNIWRQATAVYYVWGLGLTA